MKQSIDACKDTNDLWPCQVQLPVAENVISRVDWLAGEAGSKRLLFQLAIAHHLHVSNGVDHDEEVAELPSP